MKPPILFSIASACALIAFIGCSKQEEQPPPETPQTPETATNAAQNTIDTVQAQTEAVKETAEAAATNVQSQTTAATDKVQGIIEQVKALIAQNKPAEAASLLNSLNGQQLSPDQKSAIERLKEQIQKLGEAAIKTQAGDEAAKAAGGLLRQ